MGIGMNLSAVAQQFTQGNISSTENPLDLAINGAGFFQVSDGKGPVTYSRNGQFKVDREGFIVNNRQQQLRAIRPTAPAPSSRASRCRCKCPPPASTPNAEHARIAWR